MRFLIDENVNKKLIRWLLDNGHDATRIPAGTKNGKVIEFGRSESRILITHDHDFADTLRYPPEKHAGIILIEIHPPVLLKLTAALLMLLNLPPTEGFVGKLIILQDRGYELMS